MFDKHSFKEKLFNYCNSNDLRLTNNEINKYGLSLVSDEDYLKNKLEIDDIILWYTMLYCEQKISKQWYHTINLNGEKTPGIYDHATVLQDYNFDIYKIKNKRVLDVGASDGYFSVTIQRKYFKFYLTGTLS